MSGTANPPISHMPASSAHHPITAHLSWPRYLAGRAVTAQNPPRLNPRLTPDLTAAVATRSRTLKPLWSRPKKLPSVAASGHSPEGRCAVGKSVALPSVPELYNGEAMSAEEVAFTLAFLHNSAFAQNSPWRCWDAEPSPALHTKAVEPIARHIYAVHGCWWYHITLSSLYFAVPQNGPPPTVRDGGKRWDQPANDRGAGFMQCGRWSAYRVR